LAEAFPRIARAVPDVALTVTGAHTGVDLASLPRPAGVRFTGHVPDVRPLVAQSWASVVPLRLGGGTRLKILESMALGTPVVSTTKGAEGLEVADGENILLADGPPAFADRVVELIRSPELRERIAAGGRRLVERAYDWHVVGRRLSNLVRDVAGGARA
jgi:glycosyltransferase involved in cell wall biosynthesis